MADRRPPQRPASSSARRPASSGARPSASRPAGQRPNGARPAGARPAGARPAGARPSGSRPAGGSGQRGGAPRRGKHVSGRFYVFLGIVALIIIAVVLLIWRPWAKSPAPADPAMIAATTPAVMAPAADATIAPAADGQAANGGAAAQDSTALSELLGSEDTTIAGLTEDQMVQVSDLSVNTSLSPEWQNILLLGIDQRVRGESCRSDTMIICSINTETAEVKLTSLLRDMAVDFTDLGTNNGTYRLNAANYFGGPELAMKTINQPPGHEHRKIRDGQLHRLYADLRGAGRHRDGHHRGGDERDQQKTPTTSSRSPRKMAGTRATSPAPTNTSTNTARTCT